MSVLKLASDIPPARTITGEIKGSIGDHIFETDAASVILHNGAVEVTCVHLDDDHTSEEIYFRTPENVKLNEAVSLSNSSSADAWISFKNAVNPMAIQCSGAVLTIEALELSPFNLQGSLRGTTEDADYPVDITFSLKQST